MKIVGSPPESFARWCAGCVWDERPSYNPTYLWPTLPVAVREAWGLLDSDETRSVLYKALAEVAELRSQLEAQNQNALAALGKYHAEVGSLRADLEAALNQGAEDERASAERARKLAADRDEYMHQAAKNYAEVHEMRHERDEIRAQLREQREESDRLREWLRIEREAIKELDAARRRPSPPGEYEIAPNGTLAALRKDLADAQAARDEAKARLAKGLEGYASQLIDARARIRNAITALGLP